MIYLDASALVTYVTGRPDIAELRGYLEKYPTDASVTSTVGFVETVRTCDLFGSFPHLMIELLRDHDEVEVTTEIRDRAASLPGRLKTLDAIHVASAETLGEELTAFITYDRGMANVARSRGLPVVSPGMDL